ncbi:hypothetical protein KB553_09490 [Chryseobacterium rhizoplanae]|uniref:hypothetical protein n=1 Tax=Chryseobacterium rhizoplanae TaxID=1609531 RepID=UPI001CE35DBE|nr:hypothetical protein [Chryseobacterium rhizoplanae]UCA61746.1 hypothetical protein KB553_09490 [Chryseobacterium rhizoplanae]
MKKYISILSLVSVLFIYSCERDASDRNNPQQKEQSPVMQNYKTSVFNKISISETSKEDASVRDDDEEPKRDKQHWRVKNDTVKLLKP